MKLSEDMVFRITMDGPVVLEAINKMAFYMYKSCKDDGRFVYRANTDPNIEYTDTYNVLRHAGAVYALAKYGILYDQTPVRKAITRSLHWIHKHATNKIENNRRAVFTTKKNSGKDDKKQAKLGATALAMIALIESNKLGHEYVKESYLNELYNFIAWMQRDDGSFYSKYFSKGGRNNEWDSLYYPGEAALALSMFNKPKEAINTLRYLANIRKVMKTSEVESDHWALIATNSVFKNHSNHLDNFDYVLLRSHARKIMKKIIRDFDTTIKNGRTCQVATRLEGLLSMSSYDREIFNDDTEEYSNTIQRGVAFLLEAFEKTGSYVGGITREYKQEYPDNRSNEIRIDYVQHTLCALMDYHQIIFNSF